MEERKDPFFLCWRCQICNSNFQVLSLVISNIKSSIKHSMFLLTSLYLSITLSLFHSFTLSLFHPFSPSPLLPFAPLPSLPPTFLFFRPQSSMPFTESHFAMTQFLHNLYLIVTMDIIGCHRFAIKLKGGPKNEIIVDQFHSYCSSYCCNQ
jgi:hypothetical protein